MLIKGKWTANWQPVQDKDKSGRFVRQTSSFRNWVTPDGQAGPAGEAGFMAEAGRYRLYVALICPWASRVLIARKLKGLQDLIPVTVVNPHLTDQGWSFDPFPGSDPDPLCNARFMHQIYTRADPDFTGRATVPVLWDMKKNTMVNNESADIVRMFNTAFADLVPDSIDLYPAALAAGIDALNAEMYSQFNNGVYKSGFASTQQAYDEAVTGVFAMLDKLENRLSDGRPYLFGREITETDIRLFVTSIRFDAAYHGLFKTNLKQLADYPNVQAHMERMLALKSVAETINLQHIKEGYYSIKALNPSGIVPQGPKRIGMLIADAQNG